MIAKTGVFTSVLAVLLLVGCTQSQPPVPDNRQAEAEASPVPSVSGEKPDLPCAYSPASSGKSIPSMQQYGYLTDMPAPVYLSVARSLHLFDEHEKPGEIRAELPQMVAPPSGRWQVGDAIVDPNLPSWRFMGGVRSKKYWHIWLQTGGIGKAEHVLIVQPDDVADKVHVKAHFMGLYEDLCPLVQVLEQVSFWGVTMKSGELW
ncbi:hypothetical protein [Inquilinus sp.]|uniref:hypothetical protein n=1 Tax=Inquilinus sp. TaxID=1932117 RepID=UPI0031E0AF59